MKKTIIYFLVLMISLIASPTFSKESEDVIFVTSLPEDSELFEVGKEILLGVSKRINKNIKLVSIPGKRSAILLKNNEIHAEFARVNEYRARVPFAVIVPEPIVEISQYVYSYKQNIRVKNWEGLKPYRVVALRGSWVVETYVPEHTLSWVDSMPSAFKFLKHDRADVFIGSSMRIDKFLTASTLYNKDVFRLEPAIHTTRYLTFFASKYADLAIRYEEAVKAMKADGSYQKIFSKAGI